MPLTRGRAREQRAPRQHDIDLRRRARRDEHEIADRGPLGGIDAAFQKARRGLRVECLDAVVQLVTGAMLRDDACDRRIPGRVGRQRL